jgi:uncharacterized protein (TIGR03435 family)
MVDAFAMGSSLWSRGTNSQHGSEQVIDHTGLACMFGFTLMFSSFTTVPHVSDDPSIFTALREQLGLKLEPARGPVELLVIDSVEQPTPN